MSRNERIGLALVLLTAVAVRLYGLSWGLPDFYEEAYPYRVAWSMWGWGTSRGLDLNPHFFKYPSLVIYLQLAGQAVLEVLMRLTGAIHNSLDFRAMQALDPSPLVLAARAITAAFGAALVLPVFLLGRRAGGARVGMLAALLAALCPALISKSQVIEVDVPLTFFVAAALAASLALLERPSARKAAIAGVLVGLAASAKYPGSLALIPCGAAIGLATKPAGAPSRTARAEGPGRPPRRDRREARRGSARTPGAARAGDGSWLATRFRLGVVLVTASLAMFLITSPFVLLDFASFYRDFMAEREHMALGHFGVASGAAWLEYVREWFRSVAGWSFGLASVAGLIVFAGRRARWAWVLGSFVVLYFAIVGSWSMKADRYLLPLVPAGAVFAATLAVQAARALPPKLAAAGLAGAALVLLAPFFPMLPPVWARMRPDPRTAARAWIHQHVPAGALVASEEYGPALKGAMWLRTLDHELQAAVIARGTPLYATLEIPFLQVAPERAIPLYDLDLYREVDLLVVSSAVSERYRHEPQRFAQPSAFYDSLDRRFVRQARFEPLGSSGSALTIYSNPSMTTPFAARPVGPAAVPAATGGTRNPAVGFFHFNQGVDDECFGFPDQAVESYRLALRQGDVSPEDAALTRARIGHCLLAKGPQAAIAYLDTAAVAAPDPLERETLGSLRTALQERPAAFAGDALPDLRTTLTKRP